MMALFVVLALSSVVALGVIGINYSFSIGVTGTDGSRLNSSFTETGTTSINISTNLPAASVNTLVAVAWTVANTQAIMLLSSSNMTIKTNNATTPGNTINLVAGIAQTWGASSGYYPNPFTVNVTAFYVSCTAAGLLQASILTT